MSADAVLQDLAVAVYQPPLSSIRDRDEFPAIGSPLHLAVVLIDADTELAMQGTFGYLENQTGAFLPQVILALRQIGAVNRAALFESLERCMRKHGVTWRALRGDVQEMSLYLINSFSERHGLDEFSAEVTSRFRHLAVFEAAEEEDPYELLCAYLETRLEVLKNEIEEAKEAQPGATDNPDDAQRLREDH